MVYRIGITPAAQRMIKAIQADIREKIKYRIGGLAEEPEKKGKHLVGELSRFRSVHVAGRYRIIYQVNKKDAIVKIVGAGIRKEDDKCDIYTLTKKLLKAGLI